MKISRRKFLKGAAIGTAAAAGVGFWQLGEVDRLRVRHQALTLPRWDAHGLRVALLTDLHVDQDAAEALALRAIELAAQEKPDLILVVGDTISRHYQKTPQHITTVMGRLRDTGIPCYQVLGNHEYWAFRAHEVVAYLQASPVPLLRNEVQEIEGISLWGVDDALMNRWRPDSLPRKYDRNVLAMLHEPDPSEDLQGAP
ncbi:MAG: metallophosphoesterase, partial [Fimbriimonadaceae bacterium]